MQSSGRARRPTQAEIGRLAGVSQATVSLVLNDRAESISPETRARVQEVIRRWGYVANPIARSLVGGRNRIIGVYTFESVFPMDGEDFYFPFLVGVEREAEHLGYDMLMFTSVGRDRLMFRDGATRLRLADGALLLGRHPKIEEVERLRDMDYPFVYIGRREVRGQPISYVTADYAVATREVTDRLLQLGHRRLAYVRMGDGADESARDREQGFRLAIQDAGIGAGRAGVWSLAHLQELPSFFEETLASGVTALVVEQQKIAEELQLLCKDTPVTIPGSLSIAVLGDSIEAGRHDTDWAGFNVPRHQMGVEATRMLMRLLEEPSAGPFTTSIPCKLIDGTTVAPPPSTPSGSAQWKGSR
jgi:DNA-binding LacI/PurR family transcriptional regulator